MDLHQEALDDLQGEDLNLGTDCLNLVSNGIKLSDRTLTVSPNYASEIQSPEGDIASHRGTVSGTNFLGNKFVMVPFVMLYGCSFELIMT
eukprot:2148297-Amphidinium_carterae.1